MQSTPGCDHPSLPDVIIKPWRTWADYFFSPHDEVGLVDVLSAAAVPQDSAVAHHSALLKGQLQRVVLQSAKKKITWMDGQ